MSQGIVPYSSGPLIFWEPAQLQPIERYTKNLFVNAYQSLPPTEPSSNNALQTALQTISDIYTIGQKIYEHPWNFTHNLIHQISEDAQNKATENAQSLARNFFTFENISFSSTPEQCYEKVQQTFFQFASLLQQTKEDLKRMFIDLFKAFVLPISSEMSTISIPLNFLTSCAMTGAALFVHKLAIEHLKEDSDQAKSLTCGAVMGIWISFVMDQSLLVGMLSGTTVALITDTALVILSRNAITRFAKKQYKEWKVEKRAATIYKLCKKIFPYIFYTLGTAFVYAKLRPITDLLLKDTPPSSEKIYTIQLVLTSALLFGMGTSYLTMLVKSLLAPLTTGLTSAQQTSKILFWAPRVLAILSITSAISSHLKK
jgi:hypothetical protein